MVATKSAGRASIGTARGTRDNTPRSAAGEGQKSIRVHDLEMLAAENRDFGLTEITDRIHGAGIDANDDTVRSITIKLMKDGRVERVGRGQYRLARRRSRSRSADSSSAGQEDASGEAGPREPVTDSAPGAAAGTQTPGDVLGGGAFAGDRPAMQDATDAAPTDAATAAAPADPTTYPTTDLTAGPADGTMVTTGDDVAAATADVSSRRSSTTPTIDSTTIRRPAPVRLRPLPASSPRTRRPLTRRALATTTRRTRRR